MKNTYTLRVKAWFLYSISANTEKEARKILEEQGGIDIEGKLITEDYKNASLLAKEKSRCQ